MKEYKYKTSFSSVISCPLDLEKRQFISNASLQELKKIVPEEFFAEGTEDLLPIVSNLAVIGLMNKNYDALSSDEALRIYKSILHKQLNSEHNRGEIYGHVVAANFSKFDIKYMNGFGSELLTESQAKEQSKGVFNLSYAAVLYKVINSELIEHVINASDPNHENYLKISSSWELGFASYSIAIGSDVVSEATLYSKEKDEKIFNELERYLKSNNGRGKKDDEFVYRVIDKGAIFLGCALTESPAAAVAGVIVADTQEPNNTKASDATILSNISELDYETSVELLDTTINSFTSNVLNSSKVIDKLARVDSKFAVSVDDLAKSIQSAVKATIDAEISLQQLNNKNANNISHLKTLDVIANETNLIEKTSMTKITKLQDITDEALKEVKASVVVDFIEDELKKASERYVKEKDEKESLVTNLEAQRKTLAESYDSLTKKMESLQAGFDKLAQEKAEKEKLEVFNCRMASFDDKYELTPEDRKVIASQIKDLSDESFKSYESNMTVLLVNKNKETIAKQKKQEIKEVIASTTQPETVVDKAIDNATQVTATLPNTSTVKTQSMKEKYAKAFSPEELIEVKRRNQF